MLVAFFKTNEEQTCICQVIKFSDRIWFDERGNATFYRTFVVEVATESPVPLSEVKLLIPVENILNVTSKNHTCFDLKFHFNLQQLRTTDSYAIKAVPEKSAYSGVGIIDDDGISDIKVFVGEEATPKSFKVGKCTALRFRFPGKVQPGENVECRVSFIVSSLYDNLTPDDLIPEYSFFLSYFSSSYTEEISVLGKNNEIDIVPTLPGEKHPGGFDVWTFLPVNFIKVSGFSDATEKMVHRQMDGTEGPAILKLGWKLRWLLRKHGYSEFDRVNSSFGLSCDLGGIIKQRHDSALDLKKLSENTEKIPAINGSVVKLQQGERTNRIIAVTALILSILIPLGIELCKYIRDYYKF